VAKEQAGIQAQKDGLKYLSSEQKMRNEIAQQTAVMRKAGMDEAAIQERIGQIKASYDKKGSGGSRAKEISEYEKLNKRIGEFAALQTAALEADGKLTEGQRLAVRVKQDMIAAGAKLSASDKERLQTTLSAALATEQRVAAEKDLAKFLDEAAQVQAKAVDQSDKATDALKKQADAEREATAAIGLSKEAIAELAAAKYDESAASKERLANTMAEAGESDLLVKKYREEAAALRDLAKAKRDRGVAESASEADKIAAKAAEKAATDWQKAADKIENSITDALMRGFESGKDFAQNLRDVLLNMFKTMVLRPQIQGIVSGGLGALGLGGSGQAAAGGMGGMGDIASMGMNALGLGGAGAMFSSGVMSGLSAWGAGGSVTGLLGSGSALFSGGLASGLGTIAGALGPIALGIGALYAISKKLDTSGTIHTGGSASYSAAEGTQKNISQARTGFAFTYQRAETADMAASMTQSIVGMLDLTAKSFGKTAGYSAATAFADDSSRDGAWGSLIISKGGKDLLNWADSRQSKWAPKTFGDGEEGLKQYMAAVGKDVRDMLMQDTPGWADAMLQALGDAPTLDQLAGVVAQINLIQATFVQFGAAMPQLAGLSDTAVGSLLSLSGGIQNLQSGLSAYYDKFYSDAEKQAAATKRMSEQMASLGLTMPATNAEYRKLVEAQDLNTEAGRKQYAALIALAPAFDQVTAAAAQAVQRIASERTSLESQLLQAQGNTAEIRRRERAALDESNRALYDQVKALEDAKTAQEKYNDAMANIASERASLEMQLLQARGETAEIRRRERAALSESNRSIYDQIKAIEDAKAAQEAYTQALSAAQSALSAAMDRVQSAQSAVDAVRERGTSAYLAALGEVANIQEQIADQARQTASAYRDLAKQLREYVDGVVIPPSDSFAKALTKALGGDREAMAALPGLATSATDQARKTAGNREDYAASQASILAGVLQAAAEAQRLGIETPAQAAQTLQQKLLAAQQKLAEATATANAIGAPLVAQQERLIDEYRKALSALATANNEAALARAQLAAIASNTGNTATNTGTTATNTNATTTNTDTVAKEIKNLGAVISVGGLVKFDPKDPIRSVFENISKTNQVLNAQFVKWLELQSGSIVTQNTEAGTVSVSAVSGFMTEQTRKGGAAGYPGLYILQYDSTNYLMQIAANTAAALTHAASINSNSALTAGTLNNLSFGHWSMLVRGFGPGQSVPVSFKREGASTEFFATGGVFTNSVVSRPTAFSMGVMGEKSPEAIMPLANIGGSLGVRAQMPGTQGMLQALQAMQALMQRLQSASENGALTSQEHLNLVRRLTRDGRSMPVAPSPNDPLTVEINP
jgi:hypothetical protein